MFWKKKLFLINIFTLFFGHFVFADTFLEDKLPKCYVGFHETDDDYICIFEDSRRLQINKYCITENGNVFEGNGPDGKCEQVPVSRYMDIVINEFSDDEYNIEEDLIDRSDRDYNSGSTGSTYSSNNGSYDGNNLNNNIDDYCLLNNNGEIISINNGVGILNYCTSTNENIQVENNEVRTGYYHNVDSSVPYIKCSKGSNNCIAISPIIVNSDDCSGVKEGGIIGVRNGNDDIIYKICQNHEVNGKTVSLTTKGQYFISIDNENVFGKRENKYVLVDVNEKGDILKNESDNKKYKYADSNFSVQENNSSSLCNDSKNLVEFEMDDTQNHYYSKNE